MKKTYFIFLISLTFFACNTGSNDGQTNDMTKADAVVEETGTTETAPTAETGKVITLNNTTFREKVHDYKSNSKWNFKGDLPCIVDFYADWCKPCRELAPVLDELAKDYHGKIHIYKVNADYEPELSSIFGVQYLPTLLLCKANGEPLKQVGGLTKSDLVALIENNLLN
jgi:thioredoxin 1